ncbi:MAPEG family protein [Pseudodonghicola flavimaris]|uniref:MAPEG family protein n=1 Tax=Pseudodonghicola flavimaris TaxID=3050036 RepID=A0ABT7F633_9RHOB|nr:MAPEG family protein [Pseudodonghicola flavimaris]MDK3019859.1 MAPEG family protein [Pseudodonghicola flavimaris]
MTLTITALYAGLAGLMYLFLSFHVIKQRVVLKQSLGDGGDDTLNRRVRTHANFAEYAPITLILIGALEAQGAPALAVHLAGIVLILSRAAHAYGMQRDDRSWGRKYGILSCFALLLVLSVADILMALI